MASQLCCTNLLWRTDKLPNTQNNVVGCRCHRRHVNIQMMHYTKIYLYVRITRQGAVPLPYNCLSLFIFCYYTILSALFGFSGRWRQRPLLYQKRKKVAVGKSVIGILCNYDINFQILFLRKFVLAYIWKVFIMLEAHKIERFLLKCKKICCIMNI